MKPVDTEIRGELPGVVRIFAEHQEPYLPLPAFIVEDGCGSVVSRWRLTWRERIALLLGEDLFLSVMTFGARLQPVRMAVGKKVMVAGWSQAELEAANDAGETT